jgi:hypothetical protein
MTISRSRLVCSHDTPYYHVTSRCVRRTFRCGTDHYSGQCYEHRREWIRERISFLQSVFANPRVGMVHYINTSLTVH